MPGLSPGRNGKFPGRVDESLRTQPRTLPHRVLRQPFLHDYDTGDHRRHDLLYSHRYIQTQDQSCERSKALMTTAKPKTYVRFTLARRIEHIVLITTFVILAGTGLSQKYHNSPISAFIIKTLGGIENIYDIHHITSVVVMLAVTYHLLTIGYQVFVLRSKWSMMLYPQDMKD